MASKSVKEIVAGRQRAAAEIIANAARVNAAKFSKRIPGSVHVVDTSSQTLVVAGGAAAPNAYPFETGARHPLFGNTNYWYPQPKKPFMARAVRSASNLAAEEFAGVIDDLADAIL